MPGVGLSVNKRLGNKVCLLGGRLIFGQAKRISLGRQGLEGIEGFDLGKESGSDFVSWGIELSHLSLGQVAVTQLTFFPLKTPPSFLPAWLQTWCLFSQMNLRIFKILG